MILLMPGFCGTAQAQQLDPQSSSDPSDQTVLPADGIIQILRGNPELLEEIKTSLEGMMAKQGKPGEEGDLSNTVLFDRIRNDAQVRLLLTRELSKRGYASEQQPESQELAPPQLKQQPESQELALPRLKHRPAPARETSAVPPSAKEEPNQPDVAHRASPYSDLPSLHDLYTQVPSQEKPATRFGAELFKVKTGAVIPDNLPIDLPVGPDYVLGPGDTLTIDLWGSISQQLRRVVTPEGQVALPESGTVLVAGKTLADAQKLIETTLGRQFRDVKVDISLSRLRTVRVYVVGDVENPGAYDISSLSTPLNALLAAGGPTVRGSLRKIRQHRGKRLVNEVDLYDFLLHGVRSGIERLEPGDTILVPPVGTQVAVNGMVRRPAIYELKNEQTLADALELAGGVLVSANLHQINVERIEAHEKRIMLSLNIPDTNDQDLVKKALGDFHIQDGDRMTISPILPYNDQAVYLEGHVFRPGKYSYRKGMSVNELLLSYKDLLPEPADRAEIVRLQAPDFRPTVIEFNLADILLGDDPIELQPFDTVRVFGRYEYDAPKVSIQGEVLRPGKYPLTQSMTASELVRLAGGFKRSALRETADLTSYAIKNGEKVVTEHTLVEILAAVSGDAKSDVRLKPGDVLTIRQLTGWNDIGASVALSGEVLYPGTYGINEGEKLSSLLKRAGGFRSDAYPFGAVLERQQVREFDEKSRDALLRRIESAQPSVKTDSAQDANAITNTFLHQQQQIVARLKNQPPTGRLVIRISKDISRWENSPDDIELRTGDTLIIPKRPSFVLVNGQVNSPTAVTFVPGRNAGWYLARAGGPTEFANKKEIFVIRADGSVAGRSGLSEFWKGSVLSTVLQPGDTVVVPEKIVSQSAFWRNLLNTAQVTSSIAIAARVATRF